MAEIPQKLPHKPSKPYIQPARKEAKAMTIGIGMNGGDWLVMGADSQMTAQGWHKYSATKLFHDVKDERIIAMIGGDDLNLATEIWWKLLEHPIADYEDYEQALTDILDGMGRLVTDLPLQLLCGIATAKNTFLFEFRGRGIQPVTEFGVICAGDSSLIRYLRKQFDFFWQSKANAVIFASYLLKRAEEFIDGCHGPMDVIVLNPGPQIHVIGNEIINKIDEQVTGNEPKAFKELLSIPFSLPT